MLPIFEKKKEEDTYMNRLGVAQKSRPSKFWIRLPLTMAFFAGTLYANFKAWVSPPVQPGSSSRTVSILLPEPFYSMWVFYYILVDIENKNSVLTD